LIAAPSTCLLGASCLASATVLPVVAMRTWFARSSTTRRANSRDGDQGVASSFGSRERMIGTLPLPLLDRSVKAGILTGY
jgi:hypothetical protein